MSEENLLEEVIVAWLCKTLTKKFHKRYFINVDKIAVYNSDNGWLCDCGLWTTGDDRYHVPIEKDKRIVYQMSDDDFYRFR